MSGHFKLLRVCMTALFLGCKMEETPVAVRDVCAVFDRILKRRAGVDCTPLSESRLNAWRESLRSMEGILLRECGFEVSCETPHAFILHFLAYMRPRTAAAAAAGADMDAAEALEERRWAELQQRSWSALNDCLLSPKILFSFRAEVVACAAIIVAASLLALALPDEWWTLFDVRTTELDQCSLEFATLYARLSRYGDGSSGGAGSSSLLQLDYTPTDANDNETNNELLVYRPRNRRAMIEEQRRKKAEEAAAAATGSFSAAASSSAAPVAAASRPSSSPTNESNGGDTSAPMQM